MSKNIVICCDGTGNEYCDKKSNVVKLFEIIEKHSSDQVAYYDPGVGTMGSRVAVTKPGKWLTRVLGLAFAYGLTRNIEEAYEFLMDNYNGGDKVFLFGFSRGAYTVRALAGLIMKCGLLHRNSRNQIPYATKLYRQRKIKSDSEIAVGFRDTFSRICIPHFIGVWDTVKTTGPFKRYRFSDLALNENIKFGYHALAIDEKRAKFLRVPWSQAAPGQTIEQVWFPGVHCDVGGSYSECGLSNIALKWMIDKAIQQNLIIHQTKYNNIKPDCSDKIHKSYKNLWRLLGKETRFIANGASIHACAFKKMEIDENYRPKNLPPKDQVNIVDS